MDRKQENNEDSRKKAGQILKKPSLVLYVVMMSLGMFNILSHASVQLFKLLIVTFPVCWLVGLILFVSLKNEYDIPIIKKHIPDAMNARNKLILLHQRIRFYGYGSLLTALSVLLIIMFFIPIQE